MERILHFDPASMSIWYGIKWYLDAKDNEHLLDVVGAALDGKHSLAEALIGGTRLTPDPRTSENVRTLSAIWHEQRHFVDYLLTNYGHFRHRQYLSQYLNLPLLWTRTASGVEPLRLPFTSQLEPRRGFLRWPPPSGDVVGQAEDILKRERAEVRDGHRERLASGEGVSLGGHAMLESMAFMSENAAVRQAFGDPVNFVVQRSLPDNGALLNEYLWFTVMAEQAGVAMGTVELGDARVVDSDTRRLGPLIYGALAGHFGRPGATADSTLPRLRIVALMARLRECGSYSRSLAVEDAWSEVNAACEDIWGITAVDSITHDVRRGRDICDHAVASVGDHVGVHFARDCQTAREQLLEALVSDPGSVLDAERFHDDLLPRLRLPSIIADGTGRYLSETAGEPLFGGEAKDVGLEDFLWAVARRARWGEQETGLIGVQDWDSWMFVAQILAPTAKLGMRGRLEGSWGPEIASAEEMSARAGYPVEVDPWVGRRRVTVDGGLYWHYSQLEQSRCDGCEAMIARGDERWYSPWDLRASPALVSWTRARYGRYGRTLQYRDWTEWMLCSSCALEVDTLLRSSMPGMYGPPFTED